MGQGELPVLNGSIYLGAYAPQILFLLSIEKICSSSDIING